MVDPRFERLLSDFRAGKVDRRNFLVKAVALGASFGAIGSHMNAAAQDGSPEASPVGASGLIPLVPPISNTFQRPIKV